MTSPAYDHLTPPATGELVTMQAGKLTVPDQPVIPFIEGDGTGRDIWRASVRVFDAAVERAYGGKRKIAWHEVLAGQSAFNRTGTWLPDETLNAFRTELAIELVYRGIEHITPVLKLRPYYDGMFDINDKADGISKYWQTNMRQGVNNDWDPIVRESFVYFNYNPLFRLLRNV